MVNHKKASKLLIRLGEYLGFSILCGWVCLLFFLWVSKFMSDSYVAKSGVYITIQTRYWINLICIVSGIFISAFVMVLLLQRKFSYIIQISTLIEEMEAGDLSRRIPLEGEDELTDLARSINCLAEALSSNLQHSEALNQERLQTMAVLSHDLRTPLTAVMSYLQFITDGQYTDAAQLHHYAERAFDKAKRIQELSDNLFNNCMLDTDQTDSLESVNGTIFFRNVLSETKSYLTESGFDVIIKTPLDGFLFYILIDYSKMKRLFENIISNIQKYADHGYPVEFRLELTGQRVILTQSNKILEKQDKDVESHLLGLKSVKASLREMEGTLSVQEDNDFFTLEIQLPIC